MGHLAAHREAISQLESVMPVVLEIAAAVETSLRNGGKVLFFGNGGSAADAQHLSTELVVRYRQNRQPLAAIALTTDTSALTAAGNDFGYESVFSRQVLALAREGDVVIGITTSGSSPNVVAGLEAAASVGAIPVSFTGMSGGKAADLAQFAFKAPSNITAIVQECHLLCGHILCDIVESSFA
jgi:D-sedoheptulose 7-phosphate isomerase